MLLLFFNIDYYLLFILFYTDLERFLHLVTGTRHLTPDPILLDFTSRESGPAVTTHTCSRTLLLSTNITDTSQLAKELSILMCDSTFSILMCDSTFTMT